MTSFPYATRWNSDFDQSKYCDIRLTSSGFFQIPRGTKKVSHAHGIHAHSPHRRKLTQPNHKRAIPCWGYRGCYSSGGSKMTGGQDPSSLSLQIRYVVETYQLFDANDITGQNLLVQGSYSRKSVTFCIL